MLFAQSEAEQKALRDIERSMAIIDATWQTSIKGSKDNLYMADQYNTKTGWTSGSSDVWPYTAAIEAHNSLLEALEEAKDLAPDMYDSNFNQYKEQLEVLIDNLEYYRGTYKLSSYATSNKECSPYAVPRASQRGKANVTGILNVYDDQMWLSRELIRAYDITDNPEYLELAAYLADYVLEGWDCWRDENGEEYGGITWGPGYNSKHACSNAPIIQPLVWLHDRYADSGENVDYYFRDEDNAVTSVNIPRDEYYLEFAKKIYDWQKEKLLHPSGVYWDMMGADGKIEVSRGYRQHVDNGGPTGAFYSYNTGTMIGGGAELYRVTGDETYREDINDAAKSGLNTFATYKRNLNGYDFKTDNNAANGFNTWFNDVFFRGCVDALPYADNTAAENTISSFQNNLDYAFENHNRGNMLPIKLIDGWGDEEITKGFHQFTFASQYALLAKNLLESEKEEASVESLYSPDEADCNRSIYSLTGVKIGDKETKLDTLPNGIYIIGNKKIKIENR